MAVLMVPEGMPSPIVAASIALTLCKAAGVSSMGEFDETQLSKKRREMLDDIEMTPRQQQLLGEHDWLCRHVRVSKPPVSAQACPVCGFVGLVSGAGSVKCRNPRGCGGSMVRAGVLKKQLS